MTAKPDGRRTRHLHRRGELLEAVADRLAEHGLEDLRTLAGAVGISHRALLYHFGTRENLLREGLTEVRRREQERMTALAAQLQAGDVDVETLLRAAWARATAPDRQPFVRLHYQVQAAALATPAPYSEFLDGLVQSWIELLTPVVERAGVPEQDAPAVATFVFGAIRGLQLDLLSTGDRERVDAAFERLLAAALALLPSP